MPRRTAEALGRTPRKIFVPARGQYDNIGDILLRRQLLEWLRDSGPLHVYVGSSPEGYDDGLALRPEDVVYRSFGAWYRAALREAARGSASYAFKPGEIQLTLLGMKEHLAMLPVLALVRLRRGAVARVGVGARNFAAVPRALLRPSIALSSISLWRDAGTASYLGRGSVAPDLAFGEGEDAGQLSSAAGRGLLIVSMRSDRPYPSDAWRAAVRAVADRRGLDIWTVTQVQRDDAKTARLASDLGGSALRWDGTAHRVHEERLRALYRRSALVVSDRLHVLIGAVTEGAVPAALLVDRSDKIARHFAAAGIHDISIPEIRTPDPSRSNPSRSNPRRSNPRRSNPLTPGDTIPSDRMPGHALSAGELAGRLEELLDRRTAILAQLQCAQAELRSARRRLGDVLRSAPENRSAPEEGSAPGNRRAAYHVGRGGEVAGGMTQVVNGYLDWSFDAFDVRLIASRDGCTGVHAVRVAASAGVRLLRLRKRKHTVIVVHLSQGGSFLREGSLLLLARARGFATIAQLHGSSFGAFADARPWFVGRVLRAADLVLTLSTDTAEVARRFVPGNAVRLLQNAVAPAQPGVAKEPLVVFGGAVSHRKGVDVLVDAWRALMAGRAHDGWRLIVAGPVADPDVVPESLDNAEFVGAIEHDALLALLDRSAVAVLPSRDEAMPMFLLEAMARSNCVVSTTVGGIPTVLAENAGILVPPGDTSALCDALERAMSDVAFREGSAGRARARFDAEFSAEAVFPQVERAWNTALDLRFDRKSR